jgi:hypothetical protein
VPSDPFRERIPREVSGGKLKNHPFLFVDAALDLVAVQKEERFHGGMANPLVPINERVVHDQREAKRSGFGNEVSVKVQTAKGGMGLTDGGFESTKVQDSRGSAGVGKQPFVQVKNLSNGKIPHQASRR